MQPYDDLTDEELLAEIAEYRAAMKAAAIGGGFEEVAGEGRKIKYFGTDVAACRAALRELMLEAQDRGLACETGGAIAVEIG